ncbi:MAG: hypothetical protein ACOY4R_14240 [Pseudomonadota bacterium]
MNTDDQASRRRTLTKTWSLMAKKVLVILESDEVPSASALTVCQKWLDANAVTFDTLRSWAGNGGLEGLTIPTFEDDDDLQPQAGKPDALKAVVPFRKG